MNIAHGFILVLMLAACQSQNNPQTVEVKTVQIEKPKPIVPDVPTFESKKVEWVVVTPENVAEEFSKLSNGGQTPVLVAVTETGYKNLVSNLTDLQSIVIKQKVVIAAYEQAFN